MTDKIYVKVPAKAEYNATLRLMISGIATRAGFDIDALEDIKLIMSEMMVMAVKDEMDFVEIEVYVEEGELEFKANVDRDKKDDMSIMIMEALCYEVLTKKGETSVKFKREA